MPHDLKSISNVEIFSAGVWNGDKYTEQDLDGMVQAFEENKAKIRPFLKLGHDEGQKLVQNDGLPAAGWIDKIYRKGSKLVADFIDIPRKIFELIENKAYRKVSSEIYWNIDINGKRYKRLLGSVALLGANTPGVMNLNDILALYDFSEFDAVKSYTKQNKAPMIKTHSFSMGIPGDNTMPENKETKVEETKEEIVVEETKVEDTTAKTEEIVKEEPTKVDNSLEDQVKKYQSDIEIKDTEIASQKEKLEKFEAEALERAKELDAQKLASYIKDLETSELASPAMKPYIEALFNESKKEYKIEEKSFSKNELFKEMLKLHVAACSVNLKENTGVSEDVKVDNNSEDAKDEKINKYAKENDCSYREAYSVIMKDQKDALTSDDE